MPELSEYPKIPDNDKPCLVRGSTLAIIVSLMKTMRPIASSSIAIEEQRDTGTIYTATGDA